MILVPTTTTTTSTTLASASMSNTTSCSTAASTTTATSSFPVMSLLPVSSSTTFSSSCSTSSQVSVSSSIAALSSLLPVTSSLSIGSPSTTFTSSNPTSSQTEVTSSFASQSSLLPVTCSQPQLSSTASAPTPSASVLNEFFQNLSNANSADKTPMTLENDTDEMISSSLNSSVTSSTLLDSLSLTQVTELLDVPPIAVDKSMSQHTSSDCELTSIKQILAWIFNKIEPLLPIVEKVDGLDQKITDITAALESSVVHTKTLMSDFDDQVTKLHGQFETLKQHNAELTQQHYDHLQYEFEEDTPTIVNNSNNNNNNNHIDVNSPRENDIY
ncbi:MAG: hypothetical protein QF782_00240 [Porticoccaceae bacterium]|nr:hypothetical protein [Porticoccaceae bacterium]